MISVDRLTLHVPAMSEGEAARLAREVAAALRGWPVPETPIRVDAVKAAITAPSAGADDTRSLAALIAQAVMRATLREVGA